MANGDVTLSIKVSGTLTDGRDVPEFNESHVWEDIADVFDRIVTVPTSEVTVLSISTTVAGATLSTLNCLVIKNLDETNYVTIGLKDTSAETVYHQIDAGEYYVLNNDNIDVNTTGAAFSAFADIDTVTLQANTAACRCQVVAF